MRNSLKKSLAVVLAVATIAAPSMGVYAATSGNSCTPCEPAVSAPSAPAELVTEPTADTVANPGAAVSYEQASKSAVANVKNFAKKAAPGQAANVNLGNYHSVSAATMAEFSKANVDIDLTYRYLGHTLKVRIPKGYQFDPSVKYYGPVYMFWLFGQSID